MISNIKNDIKMAATDTGLYGKTRDRFEEFAIEYSKINDNFNIRKWASFFLYHEEYIFANKEILDILIKIDNK